MMEEKVVIQQDIAVDKADTKVVFGAINSPTPLWAKWVLSAQGR